MDFLKGAKDFARNPLGIIALFISLIYGFANLLLGSSAEKLTEAERWPLIIFIVLFPIFVLVAFYKLVTKHHGKLYAPGDYKDDKSFLRTLSPEEQERKLEKEVNESLGTQSIENSKSTPTEVSATTAVPSEGEEERLQRREEHRQFRDELKDIEKTVIELVSAELNVNAEMNVGIGDTDAQFDAFLQQPKGKFTFMEVKAIKSPHTAMMILDRLLYNAVVADNFFHSNFKLIIVVVYYFPKSDLDRIEKIWRKKASSCPADVEVRFIPRDEVLSA